MGQINQNSKRIDDFTVIENRRLSSLYSLLRLAPPSDIAINSCGIQPGQFVEVQIPDNAVFLRRPISICDVDSAENALIILVRKAGKGTESLCNVSEGSKINLVYPLGNGFDISNCGDRPLLIGGGVGVAPLLYLGRKLAETGVIPTFLLGARTDKDLLLIDEFKKIGMTALSTEDGSCGEKGFVTTNSILQDNWSRIYCCGPMPMMKAVACIAREKSTGCEVSLENVMACGLGACLCCVEKTTEGNLCVCKEGPVFNIDRLLW